MIMECHLPMCIVWGKELIRLYNDAFRPLVGENRHSNALGNSAYESMADIWDQIGPELEGAMAGKSFGAENFHLSLNRIGTTEDCFFNVSYSPIRDETAQVCGVLIACIETTKQVHTTRKLQDECTSLYTSLMQFPAPLAILKGPEFVYELANPVYFELVGKSDAIIGKPFREVFPDFRETELSIMESAYKTGQPFIGNEYPLPLTRNGVEITSYFTFILEPINGSTGKIEGIIVCGYDVTSQVLARKQSEQLGNKLKEALASRDEFMSVASHELKTPLTSLKLQLQMAERLVKKVALSPGSVAPDLSQVFGISNEQVNRLTILIEALLDVSRIQAGKIKFEFEKTVVSELIDRVVQQFSEQLSLAGSSIEVQISPNLVTFWDRSRMEQVITNLLSNAIKYAPGTLIQLDVSEDQGIVTLIVQDFGPGISKARLPRIFERYERATSSRNTSGLGLGLFIVNQIIQGHKGTIRAESELNQGTKFISTLPKELKHVH